MTRKRNRDLACAIDSLPPVVLPPSMTGTDVAHAISTMRQRDIRTMLQSPGLEAALLGVFGDGRALAGGSAVGKRRQTTKEMAVGKERATTKKMVL